MKISSDDINFSGLYAEKSLSNSQKKVAEIISKRLFKKTENDISYVDKIKKLGYDILIMSPEFYNPDAVRLCIIKDMNSTRLSGDTYNWLGAKVIGNAYSNFSAEEFLEKVQTKTTSCISALKKFIEKFSKS